MASSGSATITLGAAAVFGAKRSVSVAKVRRTAGVELLLDRDGELGFAGAFMREGEQTDHGLAGRFLSALGEQQRRKRAHRRAWERAGRGRRG